LTKGCIALLLSYVGTGPSFKHGSLGPDSRQVYTPYVISIGSAVFAQFTRVSYTQTHATYDMCSNRLPLWTACRRCRL